MARSETEGQVSAPLLPLSGWEQYFLFPGPTGSGFPTQPKDSHGPNALVPSGSAGPLVSGGECHCLPSWGIKASPGAGACAAQSNRIVLGLLLRSPELSPKPRGHPSLLHRVQGSSLGWPDA